MKFYWIFFTSILLISFCLRCEGLLRSTTFQILVDNLIDGPRFKVEGLRSINSTSWDRLWSSFKSTFHRHYPSIEEETQRARILRENLEYVTNSNLEESRTFQLELNEFADWKREEFNSLKKGLAIPESLQKSITDDENNKENQESVQHSLNKLYKDHYHLKRLKGNIYKKQQRDRRFLTDWLWTIFGKEKKSSHTSILDWLRTISGKEQKSNYTNIFDWREKGLVSSIKNQYKCGSCYAFATATIMETLYAKKTNSQTIVEFSPQQITDCSGNGNGGCDDGGNFPPSVHYLSEQGGKIATEASYPYTGKKQTCKTSGINYVHLGNIEYSPIPEGDEGKLAEALTNYGPIFIGIDADSRLFRFYKDGVLKINNCPTRRQDLDHAMVIVGHGYDHIVNTHYWIIKNSYGPEWGEDGYLRLAKDAGNMCGVASMAYYGKLT